MDQKELYQRSIEIIKNNQSEYGSYIASPNFKTYTYSWLRDGSYIASAMDYAGQHDSSRAFHQWVDQVVRRYRRKIDQIQNALDAGRMLEDQDFLFTRYSMAGFEDKTDETWGNFQYDGYGSWLWALGEYYRLTLDQPLIQKVWQSAMDITKYLILVWQLPSYDCWEEYPELLHPYSLACVYGGLNSVMKLAGLCDLPVNYESLQIQTRAIKNFVLEKGVCDGHITKHINQGCDENSKRSSIDSNLLGVMVPYNLVNPNSELGRKTLHYIRTELVSKNGGVYRYINDTYYGGGTWILLTAWLGWVEAVQGELDSAHQRLAWVSSKADKNGWLPEQLTDEVLDLSMKKPWLEKWGPVATPLLWSHAMYIILYEVLNE